MSSYPTLYQLLQSLNYYFFQDFKVQLHYCSKLSKASIFKAKVKILSSWSLRMSALEMSHIDLERGGGGGGLVVGHRRSVAGSEVSTGDGSGSVYFSDADDGSCYSQFYSTTGGSYDDYSFSCMSDADMGCEYAENSRRASSVSDCSVEVVTGVPEIRVHLAKVEKNCRICHLGLESNSHESGVPIELGCSCKDDLAVAHKNCAETWFKIRGNKICEICHSIARNVSGPNEIESLEQPSDTTSATAAVMSPVQPTEAQGFWQGHHVLNFLLACMVFAFVISWLFHFTVPSS